MEIITEGQVNDGLLEHFVVSEQTEPNNSLVELLFHRFEDSPKILEGMDPIVSRFAGDPGLLSEFACFMHNVCEYFGSQEQIEKLYSIIMAISYGIDGRIRPGDSIDLLHFRLILRDIARENEITGTLFVEGENYNKSRKVS
jgi:hypothetical protein